MEISLVYGGSAKVTRPTGGAAITDGVTEMGTQPTNSEAYFSQLQDILADAT